MTGEPAVTRVRSYPDRSWGSDGPTRGIEERLERGEVCSFPQLAFELDASERRFLDPRWADGKAKNVSLRWPARPAHAMGAASSSPTPRAEMRGAAGGADDLAALEALIARYADLSEAFALRLFPHYRGHLRRGNTSIRPIDVAGRPTSWRQDDSRLHVDAFPSNPTRGTRLLRVFCNVNPDGQARRWRIGEPFEAHARRFLPRLRRPLPGTAWLLHRAGITKQRRTDYDHLMLQLHDLAKADPAFQRDSPQAAVDFAPGTTWVVYSDQVPHAAMGGQHLLEQTFYLDAEHLLQPERSPLRTLERLTGRRLR